MKQEEKEEQKEKETLKREVDGRGELWENRKRGAEGRSMAAKSSYAGKTGRQEGRAEGEKLGK